MPGRIVTGLDRPWFWGLLSVAWMAVIYGLSDRPAGDYEGVGGFLSWLPFAGTVAHVGLYFVLSVFVLRTLVSIKRITIGLGVYLTLFVALVYGLLDELHQLDVAGRASEVGDVVADVFGAVLVVVFWFGAKRIRRMRRVRAGRRNGN